MMPPAASPAPPSDRASLFAAAVGAVSSMMAQTAAPPTLYGPNGKVLPSSAYQYHRKASERSGSLKNWIPRRLWTDRQAAYEREEIVARSVDLAQNDAHAAGVLDAFGASIVGPGLVPHFRLDAYRLGLSPEEDTALEAAAAAVVSDWAPYADAGERLDFYGLQYMALRMMLQYGEFLFVLPMLRDPSRPYMLALQAVNPLRLKTPLDLSGKPWLRDGVEIGEYGQPVAYWIKRVDHPSGAPFPDTSAYFVRIPRRTGHRVHVLHGYTATDPDQVRGVPLFAPAMKLFRDCADFLDAELVSNIVTAAFSVFVETGPVNPFDPAARLATDSETAYRPDGTSYTRRYQEMHPGQIWYGGPGEKPHPIAAQRPGTTFDPFIKVIQHSIAMAAGIPYPVLFKNFAGMNYASYRSAMLEAWRVYKARRLWLARGFCQPPTEMLLEEAYLRGTYPVNDFYANRRVVTVAEWIGPAKGQIEPVKEVQADILAIQHNLKSREETMLEQNRDMRATFRKLAEEETLMTELGLDEEKMPDPGEETGTREIEDDDAD